MVMGLGGPASAAGAVSRDPPEPPGVTKSAAAGPPRKIKRPDLRPAFVVIRFIRLHPGAQKCDGPTRGSLSRPRHEQNLSANPKRTAKFSRKTLLSLRLGTSLDHSKKNSSTSLKKNCRGGMPPAAVRGTVNGWSSVPCGSGCGVFRRYAAGDCEPCRS